MNSLREAVSAALATGWAAAFASINGVNAFEKTQKAGAIEVLLAEQRDKETADLA